jgi:hypothetical protein
MQERTWEAVGCTAWCGVGVIARGARATSSPPGSGTPYTVGRMFWLRRQKLVGS